MPPEAISEQVQLAFQFAKDLATQLITLSTGILAVSIAFQKDIVKSAAREHVTWLAASWFAYLTAILFGIWVLMALTGSLESTNRPVPTGLETNVTIPALLQIVAFLAATVLLLTYGFKALPQARHDSAHGATEAT